MDKNFDIPGISKPVISRQPIYQGSKFTWGEATRDGERLPIATFFEGRWIPAETITGNVIKLARELDKLRAEFGSDRSRLRAGSDRQRLIKSSAEDPTRNTC
jgi:hypothetical protein